MQDGVWEKHRSAFLPLSKHGAVLIYICILCPSLPCYFVLLSFVAVAFLVESSVWFAVAVILVSGIAVCVASLSVWPSNRGSVDVLLDGMEERNSWICGFAVVCTAVVFAGEG